MNYLFQFALIAIITFIGEALNFFIPLPIPASIYGLIILLYRTLYENHQTESGGKSSGLFSDNYADYVCTPCGQSHDSVGYFKKQSYFTFTDMPIINNYRYGSDRPDLSGADAPKRRNSAQSAGA